MFTFLVAFFADTSSAQPLGVNVNSGRWWLGAAASVLGAGIGWRVLAWGYRDLIRPRLDRFVMDARKRLPAEEDDVRLASRERNGAKEDRLLLAALERIEADHDHVVLGALERNPAEARALLVNTILREDYAMRERRDADASKALAVAEACSTALEGISAAQLAQGRALSEIPRMSGVMESFTDTIGRMDDTLRSLNGRMEHFATEQGRVAGALDEIRRRDYAGPDQRGPLPGRRVDDVPAHTDMSDHEPIAGG